MDLKKWKKVCCKKKKKACKNYFTLSPGITYYKIHLVNYKGSI